MNRAKAKPLFDRAQDIVLWPSRRIRQCAAAHRVFLTRNDKALAALTDTARGDRAFIVGLGPSLQAPDLERFKDLPSLSCNKCFLAFGETAWRPDIYHVAGINPALNNRSEILNTDFGPRCIPVHTRVVKPVLKAQTGALFHDYRGSMQKRRFGEPAYLRKNIAEGLFKGGRTAIIALIQIAYAIGYNEVILIGVDFNYAIPLPSAGKTNVPPGTVVSNGESQHFHKDYFKSGDRWAIPKLDEQRIAFQYCREAYERTGRRLLNASRNTKLDVIERVDFDSLDLD